MPSFAWVTSTSLFQTYYLLSFYNLKQSQGYWVRSDISKVPILHQHYCCKKCCTLTQKLITFFNHTLIFSKKGLKTSIVWKKYKSTKETGYPHITGFMELCVSASLQVFDSLGEVPELIKEEILQTNRCDCKCFMIITGTVSIQNQWNAGNIWLRLPYFTDRKMSGSFTCYCQHYL